MNVLRFEDGSVLVIEGHGAMDRDWTTTCACGAEIIAPVHDPPTTCGACGMALPPCTENA